MEKPLSASEAFSSPISPPPFMVGMAEVEIDTETGVVEPIDYVAVVDCGTVVNPNLARVQVEGGISQGIGMALYEDVVYSAKGKNYSNSFMQYKFQAAWMWEPSAWNLRAVTNQRTFWGEVHRGDCHQYPIPRNLQCHPECGGSNRTGTAYYSGEGIPRYAKEHSFLLIGEPLGTVIGINDSAL